MHSFKSFRIIWNQEEFVAFVEKLLSRFEELLFLDIQL